MLPAGQRTNSQTDSLLTLCSSRCWWRQTRWFLSGWSWGSRRPPGWPSAWRRSKYSPTRSRSVFYLFVSVWVINKMLRTDTRCVTVIIPLVWFRSPRRRFLIGCLTWFWWTSFLKWRYALRPKRFEFMRRLMMENSGGFSSALCSAGRPAGPAGPAHRFLQHPADVGSDRDHADQPDHSLHRTLRRESFVCGSAPSIGPWKTNWKCFTLVKEPNSLMKSGSFWEDCFKNITGFSRVPVKTDLMKIRGSLRNSAGLQPGRNSGDKPQVVCFVFLQVDGCYDINLLALT